METKVAWGESSVLSPNTMMMLDLIVIVLVGKDLGLMRMFSSIVSPTDNVLSPCSAKLNSSKQRHFTK